MTKHTATSNIFKAQTFVHVMSFCSWVGFPSQYLFSSYLVAADFPIHEVLSILNFLYMQAQVQIC